MRVPRIGSIYTPKVRRNTSTGMYQKLVDPPVCRGLSKDTVSFGTSVAYYLKKYRTLPEEIQRALSPKDAIDMFTKVGKSFWLVFESCSNLFEYICSMAYFMNQFITEGK